MPLPVPKENEPKEDFLARFMRNPDARKEFPDPKQRYAVALSYWKKKAG